MTQLFLFSGNKTLRVQEVQGKRDGCGVDTIHSAWLLGIPQEGLFLRVLEKSLLPQPQLPMGQIPRKQVAKGLGSVYCNRLRAPPAGKWAEEEGVLSWEGGAYQLCASQLSANTVALLAATGERD